MGTSGNDMAVYAKRRQRYMEAMGPRAVALIHSPPEALRNGDVQHPFRQSSDLYYLTGFREPDTTLLLRPGAEKEQVILFVRPKDRERETWDGRRAGIEGAIADFGADAAFSVAELDAKLPSLMAKTDDLYYCFGIDAAFDAKVAAILGQLRARERRVGPAPKRVVDPREVLHEMRLHKTPDEIALMRKAAEITGEAHVAAMKASAPGVNEYELEAVINYTFRRRGGEGPGYNSIVGSGENATILHYIENNRALEDGDLVLIDAGCEYDLYTADVTRTYPVSGTFSEAQRRCYEVVLEAQEAAIEMTRPGVTIDDIHEATVKILTAGMVKLGLLEGPAEARIEDESYKQFYMHRTSHWLGMDVHDVGNYSADGAPRPLEPGMVITIEPGLYIAADAETAPEELRGIGIRIEDDILVTDAGYENLTSSTPKSIEAVEAACKGS